MIDGLADGTVDAIASDHAPHHPDEKDVQFSVAPFGILGLETTVSLCLDRLVRPGHIDLTRWSTCCPPGRPAVLGLPGGSLEPGRPADLTLLDLEREVTVRADASAASRATRRSTAGGCGARPPVRSSAVFRCASMPRAETDPPSASYS